MFLGILLAHHGHAGDELGIRNLVPFLGQVEGHTQGVVLQAGCSHIGLGQNCNGILGIGHLGRDLGGLAVVFNGHVLVRVDAVGVQKIAQHVLRRGALTGGQDGTACKVCHGLDRIAAFFHYVQHAQRVDGHSLNAALRLLIQGGGQICRDGSHVQLALHQQRHDLIGSAVKLQVVIHGSGAILFHAQQVDKAHGGGAFQASNAQSIGGGQFLGFLTGSGFRSSLGDSFAGSCTGCNRAGCRTAAGGKAQRKGQSQQHGCQFFHAGFPLSSQDRAILCLKILHRTMGRSFHIFYKANLQNHLLCGSKFTIIESKIPLRVQRNCRRAVGSRIFPTEL